MVDRKWTLVFDCKNNFHFFKFHCKAKGLGNKFIFLSFCFILFLFSFPFPSHDILFDYFCFLSFVFFSYFFLSSFFSVSQKSRFSFPFQIERNMIVVTVFLSNCEPNGISFGSSSEEASNMVTVFLPIIINQTEISLVDNQIKNC